MNLPRGSPTRKCILSASFQMPNAAGEINVRAGTVFDQVDGERTDKTDRDRQSIEDRRAKLRKWRSNLSILSRLFDLPSFDHLRRYRVASEEEIDSMEIGISG